MQQLLFLKNILSANAICVLANTVLLHRAWTVRAMRARLVVKPYLGHELRMFDDFEEDVRRNMYPCVSFNVLVMILKPILYKRIN